MTDAPYDPPLDPVLEQLTALSIEHEVMPCDPALADTADFCAAYGIDPADSANAILVAGKARDGEPRPFALCLVLATHRLDVNGAVRKRLGSRKASFAGAEETAELTGMQIGGVTPFGLPAGSDVPIWIDGAVMARERVVVGGGSRNRKLLLPPEGLLALPGAEAVEDLARPIPPPDG
jgi:prolyl-tRNA editing enzyme YbaK/EbsC (Cys-tRNA(Pro) deacylase)